MSNKILIYDTTLRDGAQTEGVSFSKVDKIRIAEALDSFGVDYIEGGWPGANPKDVAFFEAARKMKFKHAKVAAFSSTRRASNAVENDPSVQTLLAAETPVATIVGKTWKLHVRDVLRVSPDVNLQLIADTCSYLRDAGREVIFDAEHFFDAYRDDSEYALAVARHAALNGASAVVLCDTNGGALPTEVQAVCAAVRKAIPENVDLGIHVHNDSNLAVADSIAGIEFGVNHIQGTINGIGERCGNADLCSVIPILELKMGKKCLPEGQVEHLCEISKFVYDHANQHPRHNQPFVGQSAFAHKGGIHVDAVRKNAETYEHLNPSSVGNERRVLVSDQSGGSNIILKAAEYNLKLDAKSPETRKILDEIKVLENEGYAFESAGASFELLMSRILKQRRSFFRLEGFRVIVEKRAHDAPCLSEATIKVRVNDEVELTAAEGDGPVNALDQALRKALLRFYPEISEVELRDFKVRILEGDAGTQSRTRVLIESSDGKQFWGTVGVSENIIEASWQALADSVEYALYRKWRQAAVDTESDSV